LAAALLASLGSVAACQSEFPGLRLTIATGSSDGVYYELGTQLATAWAGALDIARPTVLETAGSLDNIQRLQAGAADVAFGSTDAITDADAGPRKLRALARIYDDYIQIVVRADLPITTLSDLTGRKVSVGADGSQTQLVANRILRTANVTVDPIDENLNDSIADLSHGRIDAFVWSGGIPTQSIASLDRAVGVRLLDLNKDPELMTAMLRDYPVYTPAYVPAGTYGAGSVAVTTLAVPNLLLVTDRMPDDVAEALVRGLFNATGQLAIVNTAALAIDVHTAIYTEPVPLHPGAEAYYRSAKV
jgi:TRAP transporter TAXI family solute receptor